MGTEMNGSIEIELDTLRIKGDATKLFEELAKAQAEFTPVPKMSTGQVGKDRKFKYASYSTLMRCVRPALSKHGITIIQPLHYREEQAVSTTILAGHGALVQTSFAFLADPNPQEFGRHHTYYRRYQLQSMLGLEGDADADDLPDVNESREAAQYVEVSKVTGKPVEASPPKASDSVENKPVAAKEQKTNGSAKPSEPTTVAVDAAPTTTKTINELISAGMKELGWELPDVQAFYKEHVDAAGYTKTANMTIDQKRSLFKKMVEVRNVTPF